MIEPPKVPAKLRMVQVVLHWAWDPIGVRGVDMAADEYDCYALAVLEMFERGALVQDVAAHLSQIETKRMDLQPNRSKNEDVAAMMGQLHATFA